MRIILAGGGTAGHINPAIAIAETVLAEEKDSAVLFVGTKKGLERTLVPRKNFDIEYINVEGIKNKNAIKNISVGFKYIASVIKSMEIIRKFAPDVVVGTGGYVCAPVVTAANMLKIPTLIHEQNVFPGRAIKVLAKKSTVTAVSFAESIKYFKDATEIIISGNPLRPEILNTDRATSRSELNLGGDKLIVVFGGSLGARAINDVVCDYINKYGNESGVRICVATGRYGYERVRQSVDSTKYPNVDIREYIHNMDKILTAADLVVCRSGAITVSEISALGVPAVLVPSPNVINNHQEYNARALSDNGAAITILEKDFNVQSLRQAVEDVLGNETFADEMRHRAKAMGKLNATQIIYDKLCKITRNGTK